MRADPLPHCHPEACTRSGPRPLRLTVEQSEIHDLSRGFSLLA